MKNSLKPVAFLLLTLLVMSCSSIRVTADYDTQANFEDYRTFAFFKTGIDRAEISDLDKRRILRAIEAELLSKGFTKSENPDLLVSIFTKSSQRVDVYNNAWGYGAWGWGGWGPYGGFYGPGWGWGWNQPSVSTSTEGQLFIDLLDAKKKELVWQGMGTGYLTRNMEKKDALIKEFVSKIMEKYPPQLKK
ncbi:DUF4136 domain-containing protein [Tamlana fucoidanivorans]|uniref:DUF4136 domain-containing protein n=1 Tax=Allotamlana fucoidanivorans TaxID=2583814 RepID=A0A5C4SID0_9FLAO|nr:DUF4136 domain-containing protein [Tamlana fucoidanivorans]TNJ42589.1 DUF4136 domain-containing protein [Tamlana fucoidanivorans]